MDAIPLGIYRHYKGKQYEVVGFAKHSETLEDMVIYKALYGEGGIWVRPMSMWSELVETDGEAVRRFEYADDKTETARQDELSEALRSIESTLSKCEKALTKLREGTSQHTLTARRIEAFRIAVTLITEKLEAIGDA